MVDEDSRINETEKIMNTNADCNCKTSPCDNSCDCQCDWCKKNK